MVGGIHCVVDDVLVGKHLVAAHHGVLRGHDNEGGAQSNKRYLLPKFHSRYPSHQTLRIEKEIGCFKHSYRAVTKGSGCLGIYRCGKPVGSAAVAIVGIGALPSTSNT